MVYVLVSVILGVYGNVIVRVAHSNVIERLYSHISKVLHVTLVTCKTLRRFSQKIIFKFPDLIPRQGLKLEICFFYYSVYRPLQTPVPKI